MKDDPGSLLKRLVTWTASLAGVVLLLVLVLIGYVVYDRQQAVELSIEHRRTLCIELEKVKRQRRVELQEDIVSSERFLDENPEGIPGISPELIQDGIDRNKARKEALSPIDCETFAREPAQRSPPRGIR